jgi:predicted AAA+ superfamily ATPase
LETLFPGAKRFDLLLSEDFEKLSLRPQSLREEVLSLSGPLDTPVIIDEVQKIPGLMDEVHWLMTHQKRPFILCGSSARKLRRGGGNLLGGRALRYEMFPLVSREIPGFNLDRALNTGLLPRHYLADSPRKLLQAYVGDYLREEIAAEALTRNIPAFGRFLESAAFSNGEIVNFKNIAAECGVSASTVKVYFEILKDTLLGRFLPSHQKRAKRRVIHAPRFYFFDVGLANYLLKRGPVEPRSEAYGKAFEHFIFQELLAHSHYSGMDYDIAYWRTASQLEVDFVLGDGAVAVEIKSTDLAQEHHLRGLNAFQEEFRPHKSIVVSRDPHPRRVGPHEVLPWRVFLDRLWGGDIISSPVSLR